MIVQKDGTKITRKFGSLAEFVDYSEGPTDMVGDYRASRRQKRKRDFHSTGSFQEAVSLSHGWTEGAKKIENALLKVSAKGQQNRQTTRMSEVGPGSISMGAFTAGHPQPWVVSTPTQQIKRGGKIVRVLVNLSANCTVEASVMERRGASIAALVRALEHAGRRCEVTAVIGIGNYNYEVKEATLRYFVAIKRAQDRLNLPSLAFALANPDCFRRIGFSCMELEAEPIRRYYGVGAGYGTAQTVQGDKGILTLGAMRAGEDHWESDLSAHRWVVETAAAQGVKIL